MFNPRKNAMQVIEWAAFSLLPGVTENTLLQAASAMQHQFLDVQGGCLSRHLVQLGQGRYADFVTWQSQEAARAALAQAGRSAACAAYFGLMRVEHPPLLGASVFSHGGEHGLPQGMEFSLFRLRPGADSHALAAAAHRMADGLYRNEPGFTAHGVMRSAHDPGLYADVVLADSAGRAHQLCSKWGQGPFDPACQDYLELIAPGSAQLQFWDRVA